MPAGSIASMCASCCGFRESFIDSGFGGATVLVVVVVVVVVPPVDVLVPVPVVLEAVVVESFFPLPLPGPSGAWFGPWLPPGVVDPDACVPVEVPAAAPPPGVDAAPPWLPPLPCETVVVGFGAFGAPPVPRPCAAAPVTPTDAMASAAARV